MSKEFVDATIVFAAYDSGWEIVRTTLYDEECVEGWSWRSPNGEEFTCIGDWHEMPEVPDEVRNRIKILPGSSVIDKFNKKSERLERLQEEVNQNNDVLARIAIVMRDLYPPKPITKTQALEKIREIILELEPTHGPN